MVKSSISYEALKKSLETSLSHGFMTGSHKGKNGWHLSDEEFLSFFEFEFSFFLVLQWR
mgnify:CR=1 FL=1